MKSDLSAEHHQLDSGARVLFGTEPELLRGTVGRNVALTKTLRHTECPALPSITALTNSMCFLNALRYDKRLSINNIQQRPAIECMETA